MQTLRSAPSKRARAKHPHSSKAVERRHGLAVDDHEVLSDGRTVWVNDERGCVARFGPTGIDVHRCDGSGKECLFCMHGRMKAEDWRAFREAVRIHHGYEIDDRHRPWWAR